MQRLDADAVDDAQLAAMSFLARYSGRSLEAYRYDLRCFFQWVADSGIAVLDTTRAHIEVYRCRLEDRGLAPWTVDRRLSTVCGFFRFANIDGRTASKPAVIPLVPWTARTIDLAIGHRHEGPILRRRDGQRLDRCRQDFDRHAAYVVVAFVAGG